MTDHIETLVVGAGVIGLAVARELAVAGREVLVVDEAADIGTATSARNSEVIHAGIYYPTESLKAKLCVAGRTLLYDFASAHGVDAKAIGKLIVAVNDAEIPKLVALRKTALRNGVDDLRWLSSAEARELEPEVTCRAALLSPSTGIIDSRGYMLALQGGAEAHGAAVALNTRFVSAARSGMRFEVVLADVSGETTVLSCRRIVNSAGHGAHGVAASITGIEPAALPPRFLAKGNYCSVSGRSPFRHLIYPIPVPGALGTHVTLDLQGRIRLGPNIEWVESLDYAVSDEVSAQFRAACLPFWPGVAEREVTPTYSGIRPKVHGPEAAFADFVIAGPRDHGVAGLVNLFGLESPGLTASLAVARHVAGVLD